MKNAQVKNMVVGAEVLHVCPCDCEVGLLFPSLCGILVLVLWRSRGFVSIDMKRLVTLFKSNSVVSVSTVTEHGSCEVCSWDSCEEENEASKMKEKMLRKWELKEEWKRKRDKKRVKDLTRNHEWLLKEITRIRTKYHAWETCENSEVGSDSTSREGSVVTLNGRRLRDRGYYFEADHDDGYAPISDVRSLRSDEDV